MKERRGKENEISSEMSMFNLLFILCSIPERRSQGIWVEWHFHTTLYHSGKTFYARNSVHSLWKMVEAIAVRVIYIGICVNRGEMYYDRHSNSAPYSESSCVEMFCSLCNIILFSLYSNCIFIDHDVLGFGAL
jgi:hypothetical protein